MATNSEDNQEPQALASEQALASDQRDPPPNLDGVSAAAEEEAAEAAEMAEGEEAPERERMEEEEEEKTLSRADELFEQGSKAIKDGDFAEAVDCLSRALEIRVSHHGELAPECASSYYKYGSALLCKAQEETDPLGNVPKSTPPVAERVKSTASTDGSGSSKACADAEDVPSGDKQEVGGGESSNGKDHEDGNDGSDKDDEELAEEDESDLDLAWKMLDIARAIVEKNPEDTMEKVNIFSALAEVSMEREDIENSLNDYLKALSILERLVEPDHRRVVELNFRICLVFELGSKIGDAIPYCAKAISLCKSRIQGLKDAKESSLADKVDNVSATEVVSEKSELDDEIESLSGILTELEKKLEDLEQAMSTPNSVVSEVMKMIASKMAGEKDMPMPTSGSSSQMGSSSNGFESSTVLSAPTAGGTVTDLGVVGRGIKRANAKPISAEPAPKKLAADSCTEKAEGSNSEVPGPIMQDGESVSK